MVIITSVRRAADCTPVAFIDEKRPAGIYVKKRSIDAMNAVDAHTSLNASGEETGRFLKKSGSKDSAYPENLTGSEKNV